MRVMSGEVLLSAVSAAFAFPHFLKPRSAGRAHGLLERGDRTIIHPDNGAIVVVGETNGARTVYTVVSTLCLLMLALLLGKYSSNRRATIF